MSSHTQEDFSTLTTQECFHLYDQKCNELASKECELEAQKIEFDKIRNQLENENNALKLRIQSQAHELHDVQRALESATNSQTQTHKLHSDLEHSLKTKDQTINSLNAQIQALKDSKIEISQITHKKDQHIASQDANINNLNERIAALIEEKRDLNQQLLEEQSKALPLQFKYNELQQQNETMAKHTQWLESELAQKSNELTQSSYQFRQKINALESQLNALRNENDLLQQKFNNTQKAYQTQEDKLSQYMQKVKDLHMDKETIESSLQDEVLNQSRVIQLYKSTNNDLKTKVEKLITDLQNAHNRYAHDMQEKDSQLQRWIQKCTEANDQIAHLSVQLKKKQSEAQHAMEPLENVRSMLSEGLTSTHIYEKYVQASQDLIQVRAEKESIEHALNDIMKELEAKKPIFQEQKEDYERLMTSYVLQTNKYQTVLRENEQFKQQLQKLTKQATRVDDLTVENNNLSAQVTRLLQECLEYKRRIGAIRTYVSDGDAIAQGDNEDTSSEYDSSAIISEDLVTFADIDQLQRTNRELLSQIHKLKNERDQATKQMESRLSNSYKEKLSEAVSEIEKLRKERQTQITNIKSIVKQRDMLRSLLAEMEKERAHEKSSSDEAANGNSDTTSSNEDRGPSSKELRDIQMEYMKSRQLLQEELDSERKSRSTAESLSQRLRTQLEDAEARLAMKEEHLQLTGIELTHLREAKEGLIQKLLSLQESLTKTYKKLEEKEEASTTHRSTISNLQAQLNYSQERIERLLEEVDSFKKYKQAQEQLSTQLREIQNQLETQYLQEKEKASALKEREKEKTLQYKSEIKSLQQRIEELQNELFAERSKFTEQQTKEHEEMALLREERAKLVSERDAQLKRIADITQQLKESEHRLTMLIHQYTVNEEEIAADEDNESDTVPDTQDQSSATHRLRVSLSAYKQEVEVKEERIRTLKQSIEEAQQLAKERDEALQQVSEVYDKFKTHMQAQLTKSEEDNAQLKKQLDEVRDELAHTTNELLEARQQHQTQQEELQRNLQDEETGNMIPATSLRDAEDRIAKLKKDLEEEHQLFLECKKKYESEVIEHGQAMERARNLEQQLEKYSADPQLTQNQHMEFEALRAESTSWKSLESSLRDQLKELSERVEREVEQKNNLYAEIEKMTAEIEKLRVGESVTEDESQTNKHIVDLREIVRHLRREKEICQSQLQSEEKRFQILQIRYESVKKDLEEKVAQVQELQQQERPMAEEEYNTRKQLMRDLSVYQESNSTLRSQNEALQTRFDSLVAELSTSKEQVAPLKQRIDQLQHQMETKEKEADQLRRTAENWKKRVEGLLKKDTRIDPEEFESLKASKAALEKEKQELSEKVHRLESDVSKLPDLERKMQSFKQLSAKYKQENQRLEEQLKKQQEEVKKRDDAASEANQAQALGVARKHKQELRKLQNQIDVINTELEQERSKANEERNKYKPALERLTDLYKKSKARVQELLSEVESLKEQLTTATMQEEGAEEEEGEGMATNDEMTTTETAPSENITETAPEESSTVVTTESALHSGQKRKHSDVEESSEPPHKKAKLSTEVEETPVAAGETPQQQDAEEEGEEVPAVEHEDEDITAAEEGGEEEEAAESHTTAVGAEDDAAEEEGEEEVSDEEEETPNVQPIIMTSRDKIPSSKPRRIQRPKFGGQKK